MSIFAKPVAHITTEDVQELLAENAVENIRLEFKREAPGRDEMLKKVSSFANSYGGYLVIGASADSKDGRIIDLPGLQLQPGYKQTIMQWCLAGTSPPVTVEVSDPIPTSAGDGRVLYVISVPESDLGPHFLNGRKGVYVRTDEFSSHFHPQLATEYELRHLFDRRRLVRERRDKLMIRARERFATFTRQQPGQELHGSKLLPVFLTLTLVPRYPAQPVCDHAALLATLRRTRVPWRQVGFPRDVSGIITQHESAIALRPCGPASLMEANTWGMLTYATRVAEVSAEYRGIHAPHFLGSILVFLEHARSMIKSLGVSAELHVEILLQGALGVPWISFPRGFPEQGPESILDDTIQFDYHTTTDTLVAARDQVATDLFRLIFFAMNWPATADAPEKLSTLVSCPSGS